MNKKMTVSLGITLVLSACGSQGPSDPQDSDGIVDTTTCEDLQGEGYGVGEISMNWSMQDINDQTVSLYDYCGRVIYIEDTTAW